jgi:hypothetical protein
MEAGDFIRRGSNHEGQLTSTSAARGRPGPRDPTPIKERFIQAKVGALLSNDLRILWIHNNFTIPSDLCREEIQLSKLLYVDISVVLYTILKCYGRSVQYSIRYI